MKLIKRTIVCLILITCLFLISYTPYSVGETSFNFRSLNIIIPNNFVLIALIIIWLVYSYLFRIAEFLRSVFIDDRLKIEEASQNELINVLLSGQAVSSSKLADVVVCEKFTPLKEAIECFFVEQLGVKPEQYLDTAVENNKNKFLLAHKVKINITKCLQNKEYDRAKEEALRVIKSAPQYVDCIKEEILEIAKVVHFNFDPRRYKYDLSREYIKRYDEYFVIARYNETKNLSLLEKHNRKHPGNFYIANIIIDNLLLSSPINASKIINIVGDCFCAVPNRRLAKSLLCVDKQESLFETAQKITARVSDDNIEKLWFLTIVATELGHISKAVDIIKLIIAASEVDMNEITSFFLLNHSKFFKNIELLNLIRSKLDDESSDSKMS